MKITPYGETIFVLPDKEIDKTDSGLYLSDYTKKRPTSGTILSLGSKVDKELFKVGQRIIYGEFSGHRQTIDWNGEDTEIFIMTPNDIIALLE